MSDAQLEVIESDDWESRRRSFDPPEAASPFAKTAAPPWPSLPGMASEMVPSPEERLGWGRAIMVYDPREQVSSWFDDCAARGRRVLAACRTEIYRLNYGTATIRLGPAVGGGSHRT